MSRKTLFGALLVTGVLAASAFAMPGASAASPKITVSMVGGIVTVTDSANHAAVILISGQELITPTPIDNRTPNQCTRPTFDGTNFRTTCVNKPLNPLNIWDVRLGNQNDLLWASTVGSLIASGDNGADTLLGQSQTSGVNLLGNEGNDTLSLGVSPGGQAAHGGADNDTLNGGPNQGDKLFGGGGADTFNAKDGKGDNIDCGQNDNAVDTVNMDFAPIGDGNQFCANDIRR